MDEMRKMLDSLMGQSRDASLDEAKKNKGKNFTAPNVCKFHLLGFCPQNELGNSKLTTKRNLGECAKVHSDAMKIEYEEHPEKAKFQAEYEKLLLPFLESQVREADNWVSRERANARKGDGKKEETTISSMPVTVKEQVAQLTADMNKMMSAAEELAEKGDIGGSKFKVVLADEIKKKVTTEIEEQYPSYTVTLKEEWVCDVCGTRTEAVTEQNESRFAAHFTGKVHQGYAKIRDWVRLLGEKHRKEGDRGRREGSRDRDRRRSRDRDKPSAGGRDQERRRRRSGSRDRDKAEKDEEDQEDKDASGAADRERDRGGDRDRDRERDRRERRRSRSREDRGRRRG